MLGLGMGASAVKGQLMITEIMYNSPIDTLGAQDSLEFLEFYNYTTQPINLNGWTLTGGVIHSFASQVLNPGEFFVVGNATGGIGDIFGIPHDILGAGNLSNGEIIELRDPSSNIVDSVRYRSTAPWPLQANNGGYSLTLCDFTSDNGVASSWSAANTPVPGEIRYGRQIYANPGECCGYSDTTAPQISSFRIIDPTHIAIAFTEQISMPSTWINNFVGTPTVTTASRTATNDTIILTLSSPLVVGEYSTYNIRRINDLFCNQMGDDSITVIMNAGNYRLNVCEILYNDPSQNDDLEFIEIINGDTVAIPLGGLQLTGTVNFEFPEMTLGAFAKVVVAKNGPLVLSTFGPFGVAHSWDSGNLNDVQGYLQIANTAGLILDSLTYGTSGDWPVGASGTGHSIMLCNELIQNFFGGNWQVSTPGDWTVEYQGDSIFATPGNSNCRLVGIEDGLASGISVFPNPSSSYFQIQTSEKLNCKGVILDVTGRIVQSIEIENGNAILDLQNASPGVYYLRVLSNDNQSFGTRTLVRQ
jgi:hypothetical protein